MLRLFALLCLSLTALHAQDTGKTYVIPDDPRAAIAALPIAESVAEGVAITVVDGSTGEPVAGADVVSITEPTDPAMVERLQKLLIEWKGPRSELMLVYAGWCGTRYRTGDDGVARIAKVDRATLIALAGDRLGVGSTRGDPPDPIRVFGAKAVPVQVLRADGKPAAGVPLAVMRRSSRFTPPRGKTDAEGRCQLAIEPDIMASDGLLKVVASVATVEPIAADFDLRAIPDQPLVLKLPPCGQVRFILYGQDERPVPSLRGAALSLERDERMRAPASPSTAETDSALFAYVALGHEVTVHATIDGVERSLTFSGTGPTRPRELVVVEGRINVGPPILTFRVLDQEGLPVANEALGTVLLFKGSYSQSVVTTDGEGKARITTRSGGSGPRSLRILRRSASEGTDYRGAAFRALGDLTPGIQDLGDVALEDEPVAARGRLVDDVGKPIAGVWLLAEMTTTTASGGGSSRPGWWFFRHRVRTDDEGRFVVRELDPAAGPLRMDVDGEDWAFAELRAELPLGRGENELQALATGELEGRLAGTAFGGAELEVMAKREGSEVQRGAFRRPDGSFSFGRLPAGTYHLSFGDRRSPFVIDGVVVPAGGKADDPRLNPVQWKPHFRLIKAVIEDDKGRAVPDALIWCFVIREGGRGGSGHHADEEGSVAFFAPRKNVELEVQADGFATQKIETIVDDLRVRLVRIPPVTVTFDGLPELPPELEFRAVSSPRRDELRFGRGGSSITGGRIVVLPSKLGTWTVQLYLSWRAGSRRARAGLGAGAQSQIGRILSRPLLSFDFEARSEAQEPLRIELDRAVVEDLEDRIEQFREALKGHEDGDRTP